MEDDEMILNDEVETMNEETYVEDEKGGLNPAVVVGAIVGVGALACGGIAATKKFGGRMKAKAMGMKEKRILKQQDKLSKKYVKLQEEKENLVVEEEPEK